MRKTVREKLDDAKAAQEKQAAQDEADMLKVAKLFNTKEGRYVLELLMRRSGFMSNRFNMTQERPSSIRAAHRDGQSSHITFILQCMKKAGIDELKIPL